METAANKGRPDSLALDAERVIEQVRDEAIFLIDPDGRIASWNEGVGLILGWSKQDWIGQPVQVAFTPEDVAKGVPQDEMRRADTEGRADDNRWMRRRGGESFYALGAMTRMLDAHGRQIGYLKALRDFTGPLKEQQALQRLLGSESRARAFAENQAASLTAAIEAISDGVFIAYLRAGGSGGAKDDAPEGTLFMRCNTAALALLGAASVADFQVEPGALVRRFRLRRERQGPLIGPAELPLFAALQGSSQVLELWGTHLRSGADVFMRCTADPIRVAGRVEGAVVVLADLCQRLQLHEQGRDLNRLHTALEERNAELRAVTEGVRDYAIFTLDTQGRISSWHIGAQRIKGYTADEAIGMPFANLFPPEERDRGRPQKELEIAARTGEYKGEGRRQRKDGSPFDAAVVLTALRGEDGELLGYLKLTQDITQRRAEETAREALLHDAQAARAEAERVSHSKGEFLATISHELRTPLSAIVGWANVLEHGLLDPETLKHGLGAISRNARVQVQLIDDLLDMNRVESGQLRLDLQRIELGGVIAAAIDSALPTASAKGVGLRAVFGPTSDAVMGDAARLLQVVGNLLGNAIKFTPAGGEITVRLAQLDGQVQIVVADNGQGIEPAFLDRLFDRFQQQDATTTRRHGGLGIGLSVVRHLVQLHGGSVQAQSAGPGQGSSFTVLLPALLTPGTEMPPPRAAPLPAEPAPWRLDGVKVLVVDDEPDVRAVTMRLLQDAGAQVVTASSADEALDLLRQVLPAVMLSDIGMPLVDGYELLRRVRELPAEQGGRIPAAAFTAYTRPEDRDRALAAGYQLHLAKPVAPAALVAAVMRLLNVTAPAPAPAAPVRG